MMSNQGFGFGPFWHNGPSAGGFYNFPGNNNNYQTAKSSADTTFDFGSQRSS